MSRPAAMLHDVIASGAVILSYHGPVPTEVPAMSSRKPLYRCIALSLAAWLIAGTTAALAQTKPQRNDVGGDAPRSFLWVGNSFFYYNNSMHNHVGALARAADSDSKYRAVSVTISGSGIDWHDMRSYFRPDGIGKYSFVGDNEIRF